MVTLEAKHLSKRFGDVIALDDLSLQIFAGEVFCLLGPNGAGKTTLINLLLGFVTPTGGDALIAGISVAERPHDARRRCAYIPEQVQLYPNLTGVENLKFFCELGGEHTYSAADLRRYLSDAGLDDTAADRRVGRYSKGMRQKVGIAIAMAKHADVLLLDEPTSGLDPHASNEFARLLEALAARGCAVLMTTHDLFRARASGTRVGILHQGKLVAIFNTTTIGRHELEEVYLRHVRGA